MRKFLVGMIGVALVSGCSTASVNETENETIVETRPTNVLPTSDHKQDNQTQNDSTFYEPSESPTVETSESLGIPSPEESAPAKQEPKPVESSAPESSPTPSPTASQSLPEATEKPAVVYDTVSFVDNLELCKVPEYTWTGPHAKGFPIRYNAVPYTGTINVAVIPVDFSNATSEGMASLETYEKYFDFARSWSSFYSGGKMTYNIDMHTQWHRAPKEAQLYPKRGDGDQYAEMQDWIDVADDYYDFSNVHFVYFLLPKKAYSTLGADMYGMGRAVSDEGYFEARTFTYYASPELIWSHLVHEVLHDQGFIGHGPKNGSSYGIMMGQWYNSMSVLSWPSFMASWLDSDDIVCIDARDGFDDVTVDIQSLDRLGASPGIKSVIIRTGETTATVAEYRTDGRFSTMPISRQGITIYNLDTSKPSFRCDSCDPVAEKPDSKNWWSYVENPALAYEPYNNFNWKDGATITANQLTFKVITKGLITISK